MTLEFTIFIDHGYWDVRVRVDTTLQCKEHLSYNTINYFQFQLFI
jgi:hypothetical protein